MEQLRGAATWRRWTALLTGGTYFLAGCYTTVPVASTPAPGATVVLEVTDAGRVALAERLGPGVTRIEGEVTDATADDYGVRVRAVSQINAGRTRWSGESVRLRREYVVRSEERKLSRGRTALAIGATAVGIALLALTRSLLGSGGDSGGGGGNEGGGGGT